MILPEFDLPGRSCVGPPRRHRGYRARLPCQPSDPSSSTTSDSSRFRQWLEQGWETEERKEGSENPLCPNPRWKSGEWAGKLTVVPGTASRPAVEVSAGDSLGARSGEVQIPHDGFDSRGAFTSRCGPSRASTSPITSLADTSGYDRPTMVIGTEKTRRCSTGRFSRITRPHHRARRVGLRCPISLQAAKVGSC